jgi:hypothetical protein
MEWGGSLNLRIISLQSLFDPQKPILSRIICFIVFLSNLSILGLSITYLAPLELFFIPAIIIFIVGAFHPKIISSVPVWYLLSSSLLGFILWIAYFIECIPRIINKIV